MPPPLDPPVPTISEQYSLEDELRQRQPSPEVSSEMENSVLGTAQRQGSKGSNKAAFEETGRS